MLNVSFCQLDEICSFKMALKLRVAHIKYIVICYNCRISHSYVLIKTYQCLEGLSMTLWGPLIPANVHLAPVRVIRLN